MSTFGEKIKKLRKSKNLSIGELVTELNKIYKTNISKSMISRYENDTADPKMENIRILADYFNVSADYLVGIKDENNNITTIAAHHDGDEDWTEEELEEIERFKEFIRSKRKRQE
ncbi:helix-turn-helix transcriptional regulator [Aeribacillus composti]|uniref:Helix-turn-helix transcriptional regulator n=1 Tax=Aeribacillus composti TaxID=1868734 RepID=A0ABY9WCD0_9BACI|nr:helix-turn-helix transcriptional regulator [Aeribacillus composti]TVZ81252.1 helix-turn-helix protein [Aeribacillus composti]WNF33800.1 helix-turn-helix transcriptional regulator [Aeribacillus composti]